MNEMREKKNFYHDIMYFHNFITERNKGYIFLIAMNVTRMPVMIAE